MKRLYLTAVVTVPSEEGQKRIDEALEKQNLSMIQEVFKDEHGHTREFCEGISAKLPNGFVEAEKEFYSTTQSSEIDENGFMNLLPEELEFDFIDYLVPLKNVFDVTDAPEIGSYLELTSGKVVHVEQTVEEINLYLTMLELSWWDKFKIRFSNLFARKK